jgi:hypothetical protein
MNTGEGLVVPLTVGELVEALIAWHDLEWRTPGDGASPFAADGPWHLIRREAGDLTGEYSTMLVETERGLQLMPKRDTPRVRSPLSSAEVEAREMLRGWIAMLSDPVDRKVVAHASWYLWRGSAQIEWSAIARRIGYERSTRRLAGRWREALCKLLCRVNDLPERHYRDIMGRVDWCAVMAMRGDDECETFL